MYKRQVHPFVFNDFNKWKKNLISKYVIFESAIIFETGSYKKNDFNILVISDIKERIKRVVKRDGVNEKDVRIRINNQWSDDKKIPLSDYIFNNNISLNENKKNVIKMIKVIDEELNFL